LTCSEQVLYVINPHIIAKEQAECINSLPVLSAGSLCHRKASKGIKYVQLPPAHLAIRQTQICQACRPTTK